MAIWPCEGCVLAGLTMERCLYFGKTPDPPANHCARHTAKILKRNQRTEIWTGWKLSKSLEKCVASACLQFVFFELVYMKVHVCVFVYIFHVYVCVCLFAFLSLCVCVSLLLFFMYVCVCVFSCLYMGNCLYVCVFVCKEWCDEIALSVCQCWSWWFLAARVKIWPPLTTILYKSKASKTW